MDPLTQPLLVPHREPGTDSCEPLKIGKFLELLKQEEDYWDGEQNNTKLMITRLRKIFYDKWGWDERLIPQSANVENRYLVDVVDEPEEGPEELLRQGAKKLRWHKISHKKAALRVKYRKVTYRPDDRVFGDSRENQTPEIYKCHHQEVLLPDGYFCDLGHTLAGLDAINHKEPVGLLPLRPNLFIGPHVDSNADIVTWLGDIASVASDFLLEQRENGKDPIGAIREQEIIDRGAPGSDMLGNIDSFVIAKHYAIGAGQGQRVTEILRDYYLGTGANPPFRNYRFSTYCKEVGLAWNGRYFPDEYKWLEKYHKQLRDNICFQVHSLTGWKNPKLFFKNMKLLFEIWFNRHEEILKKDILLLIWIEALKDNIIRHEQNGGAPAQPPPAYMGKEHIMPGPDLRTSE